MKPHDAHTLFNIDCTCLFMDTFPPLPPGQPFSARILCDYIDLLADNGIDTVLLNANAQKPFAPTKTVAPAYDGYTHGDRTYVRGHYPPTDDTFTPAQLEQRLDQTTSLLDHYLDVLDEGKDWYAEMAAACRRRGMAPWVSVRMNDAHGSNSWENSFMNAPPQRDPRLRLSGRLPNSREGVRKQWQLMNYEHAEVRDYMFAMIKEFVTAYDHEGLELDWLRAPFCCEPPASEKTSETMLEWMAAIRDLTRQRAAEAGCPYPLGIRVPFRLDALKTIGLDIREMAARDLIDFVGFSNFFQASWDAPYDRLRSGVGDNVAIYGVMECQPNWLEAMEGPEKNSETADHADGRELKQKETKGTKKQDGRRRGPRLLSTSPAMIRANAAGKLVMGVDGIECFNFFAADEANRFDARNPDKTKRQAAYPALKGLSDLEGLRGKPKHYAMAAMPCRYGFPIFEFAEQLPRTIRPDEQGVFRLSMCREQQSGFEQPPSRGYGAPGKDAKGTKTETEKMTVQVVVEKSDDLPDVGLSFNGSWPTYEATPTDRLLLPTGVYTHHVPEHQALNFDIDPSKIQEGWNELILTNGSHSPEGNPIRVVSIEIKVNGKA